MLSFFGAGKRRALPRFKRLKVHHKLYFSYAATPEYKSREKIELKRYAEKHLELPPLNHAS